MRHSMRPRPTPEGVTRLANVNWAAIKAHEEKWRDLPTLQVTPSPDSVLKSKKKRF